MSDAVADLLVETSVQIVLQDEFENRVADAQLVSLPQVGLVHLLPVDMGAIGAAQIADRDPLQPAGKIPGKLEEGVPTRDQVGGYAQVGPLVPPQNQFAAAQPVFPPDLAPLDHDQAWMLAGQRG